VHITAQCLLVLSSRAYLYLYLFWRSYVITISSCCHRSTQPPQGDHLSGKRGNVREFGTCQEMSGMLLTVRELSGKKSCHGKVSQNCSLLGASIDTTSTCCSTKTLYALVVWYIRVWVICFMQYITCWSSELKQKMPFVTWWPTAAVVAFLGPNFWKLLTNFRKIFISSSEVNKLQFRRFFVAGDTHRCKPIVCFRRCQRLPM